MTTTTTSPIHLLFSGDTEALAQDLSSHFPSARLHLIPLHRLPPPPSSTAPKLSIVFFSPKLLDFLQHRPVDAYSACGRLDPASTVALFCMGVKEKAVQCYHRAPLSDFAGWRKLEAGGKAKKGFPKELLDRVAQVVEETEVLEVEVVPRMLSKLGNSIYFIFKKVVKNSNEIKVILKDQKHIDVPLETVNPYVMRCNVPDILFEFSHNVKVVLQSSGQPVSEVTVHLSQDSPKLNQEDCSPEPQCQVQNFRKHESMLEEHIQFLDSFCPEYRERFLKGLHENMKGVTNGTIHDQEFYELCKSIGLEELGSQFSSESQCPFAETGKNNGYFDPMSDNDCKLPDMDSSNRIEQFLNEEENMYRLRSTHRSLSLPSTLIPSIEDRESLHQYIDMSNKEPKPHELLLWNLRNRNGESKISSKGSLKKKTQSSSSSHLYVSLVLDGSSTEPERRRAVLRKDLSVSQQELLDIMLDFKEGECSLSSVEREVEEWRERHCSRRESLLRKTFTTGEKKKTIFVLPWRSTKKKMSKEEKATSVKKSERESQSNDSSCVRPILASSSSICSSDVSHKRYSRCYGNISYKLEDALSPGIRSPKELPTCPLFPDMYPPPLPSRPPPSPVVIKSMKPMPLPRSGLPTSSGSSKDTESSVSQSNKCPFNFDAEDIRNRNTEDLCKTYRLEDLWSSKPTSPYKKGFEDKEIEDSKRVSVKSMGSDNQRSEKNLSIENLCEKYGFEELGNYVSWLHSKKVPPSGKLFSNKDQISKYSQRIIRENHADVRMGMVRRSTSLPSNLQKFGDSKNTSEGSDQSLSSDNQNSIANSSMEKNIYMTMLELRNSRSHLPPPATQQLEGSQQELLQLIYAFKRGDKTISQVERQFQDWHTRRGVQSQPSKKPPVSPFKLPLKALLWKLGKKKSSDRILDGNKRLSKISCTSNSSMNSECSDVCKLNFGRSELNGFTSPCPQYRSQEPPPLPPRNFACPLIHPDSNPGPELPPLPIALETLKDSPVEKGAEKEEPCVTVTCSPKKEKPTPPPKPKMLLKGNMSAEMKRRQFEIQAKIQGSLVQSENNAEQEKTASENPDSVDRPESPDYIVPNIPVLRRNRQKPLLEPKRTSKPTTNQTQLPINPPVLPPTRRRGSGDAGPSISICDVNPPLPAQTMQLLMSANLLCPTQDMAKSMFYVNSSPMPTRPMSTPSMRELSKHNTYMELLGLVSGVVQGTGDADSENGGGEKSGICSFE